MADRKFHGRKEQRADVERMLDHKREQTAILTGHGIIPQDLIDFTSGLN